MANNYQKVYMNQIHSSTLLCELATMWKTQMLCDAIIRTGSVVTKAHRVVLVAACPMLQSMENAATGSHLEVRLAADIKQEAVNTFLQYLYEGVMILTEENCKDVEKVARLLQVESVTKCCADFYKCVLSKAGAPVPQQYKYSFHDHIEYKHVRTTNLQKMSQERQMKRTSEFSRPGSPGHKRARSNHDDSIDVMGADRLEDSSHSYGTGDIWDRVPRLGSGMPRGSKSGSVEHVEESLELVQHDPTEKDGQVSQILTPQQKMGVSIAVASQFNTEPDVSVVNIASNKDPSRGSVDTVAADDSGGHLSSMNRHQNFSSQQDYNYREQQLVPQQDYYRQNADLSYKQQPPLGPLTQAIHHMHSSTPSKSFAIGSASQSTGMSSSPSLSPSSVRRRATPVSISGPGISNITSTQDTGFEDTAGGQSSLRTDDSNSGDIDLSIVKVESGPLPTTSSISSGIVTDTGGLDMHVDTDDGGISLNQQNVVLEEGDELSDTELEDWAKEEMSNEGSNVSGDQSFAQAYKGVADQKEMRDPEGVTGKHQCLICGELCSSSRDLFKHRHTHRQKGFTCSICSAVLKDSEALKRHLHASHTNQFSHFCYICGKGFKSYPGFYNHEKIYHREDISCPSCDTCGKTFPCISRLELHKRTHSTDQPFLCRVCGKSYKYKQSLKEHTCCHT